YLATARAELALASGQSGPAADLARDALALAQEVDYESGIHAARLTLGRALLALCHPAAAARELEAAAEGFTATGERLEAARARAEQAAALAALDGSDRQPHHLYQQALHTLHDLNADPWVSKLPPL